MRKMPCLFVRNFTGHSSFEITDQVTPGCEWVANGEGAAYIKRDGTACAVFAGRPYRRYDAKRGKSPPKGAVPCDLAPDPVTGHWPHWIHVTPEDPNAKWHHEAWMNDPQRADGTYELCGPHFQANPERLEVDRFFHHRSELFQGAPTSFDGLRSLLDALDHEGLVFRHRHHTDIMCKIRRHDFGFPWGHK